MPSADAQFAPGSPAVDAAIAQLEAAIGGRQALVDTFVAAPPDAECDRLLGLIADPRHDHRTLASLCAEAGLTAGELLRLYRTAAVAKAQVLAIHEVAQEAPAVVRDVMRRAQNHYRLCTGCFGSGEVWQQPEDADGNPLGEPVKVPHRLCDGTGQLLSDASLDHQKLALDLAGLVSKGGPSIQIDNSRTSVTAIAAVPFAQLQKAVQKVLDPGSPLLLAPTSPPIEAHIVDAPSSVSPAHAPQPS